MYSDNTRLNTNDLNDILDVTRKLTLTENVQYIAEEQLLNEVIEKNENVLIDCVNKLSESFYKDYGVELTEEDLNEMFGALGAAVGGIFSHAKNAVASSVNNARASGQAKKEDYYAQKMQLAALKKKRLMQGSADSSRKLADLNPSNDTADRSAKSRQDDADTAHLNAKQVVGFANARDRGRRGSGRRTP